MDLSNDDQIGAFLWCQLCVEQQQPYNVEVGWTELGLQVWCKNHECNVVNIDFEGHRHPADTTRKVKHSGLEVVK